MRRMWEKKTCSMALWLQSMTKRKKEKKTQVRLADIANKYSIKAKFEQSRLFFIAPIILYKRRFQTVTYKKKALENLIKASINIIAS